ncbi:MAG: hypothetical protein JSR73_06505 [Proteobacteria bacterium]|nr:hypothetical protein [Pseudomonadota bacterium]
MRPPLLSDEAIRAAIRELEAGERRVTGVAIRRLLADRYGARGGVSRVYRLMHEASRRGTSPLPRAPARGPVDESREAAVARADLAEERERVHQARWARETDELRGRLARAELAGRELEAARQRLADLGRALASAQARIEALERALAERVP